MASLSVLFGFGALKRRKLRFLEEKIVEKGARDRLMVLWRSVMVCGRVEVWGEEEELCCFWCFFGDFWWEFGFLLTSFCGDSWGWGEDKVRILIGLELGVEFRGDFLGFWAGEESGVRVHWSVVEFSICDLEIRVGIFWRSWSFFSCSNGEEEKTRWFSWNRALDRC